MIAIEKIEKLTKEKLDLITLVTGEDLGQLTQLKSALMDKIAYDKDDLTYSYFDLSESNYQDAELDLLSLPFFADQKVVIFDQFLDLTTTKKNYLKENELKSFESYLEQPMDSTRLIIFAPGKLDGKRRIVKLLKRDAQVIEANLLKDAELKTYFQKYSHHLGLSYDSGVFERLLFKSNDDFSQIMKNINFLKSYKKEGHITLTDIDEAIPKSLQDNIFDLTRFILQKKVEESTNLVHDLRLNGEDEVKLIAILLGQFRLFLQIAILGNQGKNEQQIVLALSDFLGRKINPYQVKYAMKDSRTLSLAYLYSAVKSLIETDYQIKNGTYDKSYLFDVLLLKLMS
ncbi:DNA polymerase III subunit delta [Streptococcus hongkongensis]|nr:DNA polymerase III subunit delta [Streptococcus uberis]